MVCAYLYLSIHGPALILEFLWLFLTGFEPRNTDFEDDHY